MVTHTPSRPSHAQALEEGYRAQLQAALQSMHEQNQMYIEEVSQRNHSIRQQTEQALAQQEAMCEDMEKRVRVLTEETKVLREENCKRIETETALRQACMEQDAGV